MTKQNFRKRCCVLLVALASFIGASLKAQVAPTGLVANWQFDGNVLDVSGNGINGTFATTNYNYAADRFGNANSAISFPGTGFTSGVTASGLNLSGSSFTLSLWYKKSVIDADAYPLLIGSLSAPGANEIVGLGVDPGYPKVDLRFTFWVNDQSYNSSGGVNTDIVNRWYNLVGTYDAGTKIRNLYLDGQLLSTQTNVDPFVGGSQVKMGYNGLTMDDVRVYNRALSATEVASLNVVPEPTTYVMVGISLLLMLSIARKNRLRSLSC